MKTSVLSPALVLVSMFANLAIENRNINPSVNEGRLSFLLSELNLTKFNKVELTTLLSDVNNYLNSDNISEREYDKVVNYQFVIESLLIHFSN